MRQTISRPLKYIHNEFFIQHTQTLIRDTLLVLAFIQHMLYPNRKQCRLFTVAPHGSERFHSPTDHRFCFNSNHSPLSSTRCVQWIVSAIRLTYQ